MSNILSMTAFGRGEKSSAGQSWTVEIRSVNHRFCDIKIRLPRKLAALEEAIKKEVSTAFTRGHVEVAVNCDGNEEANYQLRADLPLARQYFRCLQEIISDLGLNTQPDLATVASYREVIVSENREENLEEIWAEGLGPALAAALTACQQMRRTEGDNLRADLLARLAFIAGAAGKIETLVPQLRADREAALKERLATLLNGVDLDPQRLAQEVAIMADKADVTEELVRLRSHIGQFEKFLDLDEAVGRRLDFLLQEFLREINTIASKIANAEIAHLGVELKNELEKMREQVQNLE
ncbi:MAG: YicC family protein [Desulfobulbaceae bacterium]|nr:YicC family protein [Desulfobulbaceae bacterium]